MVCTTIFMASSSRGLVIQFGSTLQKLLSQTIRCLGIFTDLMVMADFKSGKSHIDVIYIKYHLNFDKYTLVTLESTYVTLFNIDFNALWPE